MCLLHGVCPMVLVGVPGGAMCSLVCVWVQVGSLVPGSVADPLYDGSALANRGMIVGSINYRLGMCGWFAHPALSAESPDHLSGNYGLLDQIAALQWVRRNIGDRKSTRLNSSH